MDPFKTGPIGLFATAIVSLGKSGRFRLVWCNCKTASFLWREESVHDGPVFIGYGMDKNCLKIIYGDTVFKNYAKIKMTGSIIGPAGKKLK